MSTLLIPNTCQVPNVLLDEIMPRLSSVALKVLLVIVRQTYGFNLPSRQIGLDRLAKLSGLSKQGVLNGIKELGELITVKHGPRNSRISNEYGLNIDISTGQLVNKIDLSNLLTSQKNEAGPVKSFDSLKPNMKPNKTEPKFSSPISKKRKQVVRDPAMLAAFDAFYRAYPRHVAREAGLKAWLQLNPDEKLQAVIMAGVARYRDENADAEPKHIAHPASWLNGRRWEDEPAALNGNGNGHAKPPEVKDLGNGMIEVNGRQMDRATYERRYGQVTA